MFSLKITRFNLYFSFCSLSKIRFKVLEGKKQDKTFFKIFLQIKISQIASFAEVILVTQGLNVSFMEMEFCNSRFKVVSCQTYFCVVSGQVLFSQSTFSKLGTFRFRLTLKSKNIFSSFT